MGIEIDWELPDDIEDYSIEQLLNEFQMAVENLPGSGARGRSRFYKVREELKRRLNETE